MKTTTIVLLVLCLVTMLTVAAPAVAEEEPTESEEGTCARVYLDEPQVVVDQWCVIGKVTALIT